MLNYQNHKAMGWNSIHNFQVWLFFFYGHDFLGFIIADISRRIVVGRIISCTVPICFWGGGIGWIRSFTLISRLSFLCWLLKDKWSNRVIILAAYPFYLVEWTVGGINVIYKLAELPCIFNRFLELDETVGLLIPFLGLQEFT